MTQRSEVTLSAAWNMLIKFRRMAEFGWACVGGETGPVEVYWNGVIWELPGLSSDIADRNKSLVLGCEQIGDWWTDVMEGMPTAMRTPLDEATIWDFVFFGVLAYSDLRKKRRREQQGSQILSLIHI